jgi:hypothetical protein
MAYSSKEKRLAYQRAYLQRPEVRDRVRGLKRESMRKWHAKHKDRVNAIRRAAKYGLTVEQRDAMLIGQGGVCKVCKRAPNGKKQNKILHLDHCHATGRVRGLLCNHCNVALGCAGDSPDRLRALATYLEQNSD